MLLVPDGWQEGAQWCDTQAEPSDSSLQVSVGRAVLKFHGSTFFYVSGLRKALKEFKPDVILLHEEPWSLCAAQVLAYRRLYCPTARLVFKSWQNIYKRFPPPFSIIERLMLRAADAAITGNAEVLDVLTRKGLTKPAAIIPLGVDETQFRPMSAGELRAELGAGEGQTLIGFVGRIDRQKGIHTLVESIAMLPAFVRLALIGNGSFASEARELTRRLEVSDRVTFVDAVNWSDVPRYMNALDILVLPSITTPSWKEQYGRVLVEAAACGTVAVGSDSGEIPRVVGDPRLVFHEGDAKALAATIQRLLDTPLLLLKLSQQVRERALRLYSCRVLAQQTLELCRSVAMAPSRRAAGNRGHQSAKENGRKRVS